MKEVTRFEYSPLLALEVDEPTLRLLATLPEVAEIIEDGVRAPMVAESIEVY